MTSTDFDTYNEKKIGREFEKLVAPLASEPTTREYFPEALHIHKGSESLSSKDVGILARQRTSSPSNGGKLRDAQREAYERQMTFEPGCTCCIMLANSSSDDNVASQVRIIELWETMKDFYFHESSDWHAKGEEKVVPLVVNMDCDFVDGVRLLC